MTDAAWSTIATTVGLVAVAWIQRGQGKKINSIAVVAENTQRMGKATHTLVNSNYGAQLGISAAALRRIADLTKDEAYVKLADAARAALEEHLRKQAIVDAGPSPDATATGQDESRIS